MSAPESLKEAYAEEIKDLWSANDQMARTLKTLTEKASDQSLKSLLTEAMSGIQKHTETVKSLIQETGEEVSKEHCAGMEGLVREALKHGVKEAAEDSELHDIAIIAQYQRMSHYGIAGFGTAAAYAKALGMSKHESSLKQIVSDIYKSDEVSSDLGKRLAKAAAKHAQKSAA